MAGFDSRIYINENFHVDDLLRRVQNISLSDDPVLTVKRWL